MTPITLTQYLGPYDDDRITPEVRTNAERLVPIVNTVLTAMEADGVQLQTDSDTGCYIGGNGNGGVRPPGSSVGAAKSAHKRGTAIDLYDPERKLAAWAWANKPLLELLGIRGMERPEWTPTWLHLQTEQVASKVFAFIPNSSPPLVAALPEQLA